MAYRSITVNLTQAQYAQLQAEAEARTTSISHLLRVLLKERLGELKKEKP